MPLRSFPEYRKSQIKALSDSTWGGELSMGLTNWGVTRRAITRELKMIFTAKESRVSQL